MGGDPIGMLLPNRMGADCMLVRPGEEGQTPARNEKGTTLENVVPF